MPKLIVNGQETLPFEDRVLTLRQVGSRIQRRFGGPDSQYSVNAFNRLKVLANIGAIKPLERPGSGRALRFPMQEAALAAAAMEVGRFRTDDHLIRQTLMKLRHNPAALRMLMEATRVERNYRVVIQYYPEQMHVADAQVVEGSVTVDSHLPVLIIPLNPLVLVAFDWADEQATDEDIDD